MFKLGDIVGYANDNKRYELTTSPVRINKAWYQFNTVPAYGNEGWLLVARQNIENDKFKKFA